MVIALSIGAAVSGAACVANEAEGAGSGDPALADAAPSDAAPAEGDAESDSGGDDAGTSPEAGTRWMPKPGTSWQWQLTGKLDTSFDVVAYDIDLFDTPAETIASLQAAGRKVICYFSAGSWEEWRDDADSFPDDVLGSTLDGWPDERWLDIRSSEVKAVMRKRLDVAAEKKCDAVEPDNIDGYANANGLGLTAADQLAYNRFLAAEAHARNLSIALKNDLDQVPELVNDFDFALNEECFQYDECDALLPFLQAGKAVLHVEYGDPSLATTICPKANALNFDTLIKNLDLDAARTACR